MEIGLFFELRYRLLVVLLIFVYVHDYLWFSYKTFIDKDVDLLDGLGLNIDRPNPISTMVELLSMY